MPSNSPGQADIAQMLGVSVSTVSRALADSDAVAPDVKARVMETAVQIGYPLRAKRAETGLSKVTVFAVLQSFRDTRSSVYHGLLEGLRSSAAAQNVELDTVMVRSGDILPEGYVDEARGGGACVYLGVTPAPGVFEQLRAARIPAVACNGVEDDLLVDCVAPANHSGGKQMARLLLKYGHMRVAFLFGPDRPTLNRRFLGARIVIEQAGGEVVGSLELGSQESADGEAKFRSWYEETGKQATALFCFNDAAAVWVQEMLDSMGVSVPGMVSVVGFDDMPIAELATPPLTTFRIDWVDIGRRAYSMLEHRALSPDAPAQLLQVGGSLIERASVAQAP